MTPDHCLRPVPCTIYYNPRPNNHIRSMYINSYDRYTCTHTRPYTHTRIHAYTHTRLHAYTHTRIHAYTHTRIHQGVAWADLGPPLFSGCSPLFTSPPIGGGRGIVMPMSVCLCVCVCVCPCLSVFSQNFKV